MRTIQSDIHTGLLTRAEFAAAVFARDGHRCVICDKPAVDAHHIIERRLWLDGGYYLDNGAAVCQDCHLLAEQTVISCEQLRAAARINRILLPEHLYDDHTYDKWGNVILPDGRRVRGELWADLSVQKILAAGGVLPLFTPYVKYPRTYHLPWSPGVSKSDRVWKNTQALENRHVTVTEKLDGENITLYRDCVHARAVEGQHYPWQDWVRNLQARIGWELPDGWRLCGEYLYSPHAIQYTELPSYFLVFAIYDADNVCLSWEETVGYASILGLPTVPVLYRGPWDERAVRACYTGRSRYGSESEGYVVRPTDAFPFSQYRHLVGKYVREGHVPEHGGHLRAGRYLANSLAPKAT